MVDIIHVEPLDDLYDHDTTNSFFCQCNPKILKEENGTIVIHNAWDGREWIENLENTITLS